MDFNTAQNIFATRSMGKAVDLKGAKDKAILSNASKIAVSSDEIKDSVWARREKGTALNLFKAFKSGRLSEELKDYTPEESKTGKSRRS